MKTEHANFHRSLKIMIYQTHNQQHIRTFIMDLGFLVYIRVERKKYLFQLEKSLGRENMLIQVTFQEKKIWGQNFENWWCPGHFLFWSYYASNYNRKNRFLRHDQK